MKAEARDREPLGRRGAVEAVRDALEPGSGPRLCGGVQPPRRRELGLELERELVIVVAELRDRLLQRRDRLVEVPRREERSGELARDLGSLRGLGGRGERLAQVPGSCRVAGDALGAAELAQQRATSTSIGGGSCTARRR